MSAAEAWRYAVALLLALALWAVGRGAAELAAVAAIAAIGTPHGAADIVRLRGLARRWTGALLLALLYFLLAALVWRLFARWPALGLLVFVLISLQHFGECDAHRERAPVGYANAVIVIAAPFVFWHASVAGYLQWLGLSDAMSHLFRPWAAALACVAALLIAGASRGRALWRSSTPWIALASLALPPALGFAVYFCALHAPRHWAQLREQSVALPWKPIAATLAATFALGAWLLLRDPALPLQQRSVQVLVMGLAALTVPHMALDALIRERQRRAA